MFIFNLSLLLFYALLVILSSLPKLFLPSLLLLCKISFVSLLTLCFCNYYIYYFVAVIILVLIGIIIITIISITYCLILCYLIIFIAILFIIIIVIIIYWFQVVNRELSIPNYSFISVFVQYLGYALILFISVSNISLIYCILNFQFLLQRFL